MITQGWLRLRRFGTASLTTGRRREQGRRLRGSSLGFGLPRLEALEDRTLLATVTTLAATNVTATGATLNGTVNPQGTSTDASFQYSTDPGLAPNVVTTFAGTAGTAGSADGTGTAATFNAPQALAVNPTTGIIYVADTTNDTIRMITPAGVVTTLAGTAGTAGSADGTGTAATFNAPQGLALDPTTGNIYVADTGNDTIRMVTPAGVVTTLAGTAGTAGSTDGTGAAATFNAPRGLAVNNTGNIYVADTGNDTIRMVTPAGVVTTLAGTAGTAGSADGTGTAASFNAPRGLAVNSTGNIYVADTGNDTIRMVTPAGVVTTLAGTAGTAGSADGTGTAATFNGPQGLAVDPTSGNIYVADRGNDTIRMVTPAGVVTTLAGTAGTAGSANGTGTAATFNGPQGLAVNSTGNVYVADTGNDTIRQLSPLTVSAQTGLTGTTDQSISAPLTGLTPNTTYYFRAVATSAGGSATGAIMNFTTTAAAVAPTDTTQAATAVTGTTATLNETVNPDGTSTDAYFQYSTNPSLAPNVVTTFAGTAGTAGSADGTGTAATFNAPQALAVNPTTGIIYVADTTNDTIRMITPAGVVTTLAGTAGTAGSADGTGTAATFNAPQGLAVDPTTGNIYVADTGNDTIRMITPAGVVTTLAGTAGTAGSADGTGTAATFNAPRGLAVNGAGDIYVADTGNDTIRMITPAGVVTTLAGTAGTAGSADGTGTAASFNAPRGLAVNSAGNIYVADTGNDTIRMVTHAGVVTTLAGTAGTAGSADGTGTAATFNGPQGLAVDPTSGNIYVADRGNDTIRMVTPAGVVTTLAGTAGTAGSANGTGTAATFNGPQGLAVNSTGNVYVADTGNDTIRQLSPLTVSAQTGLTGTTDQSISAPLTGLTPNTTYYFRAVATSAGGSATGAIMNFTTTAAAVAPSATTQAATAVTGTTATLNGTVNPQGSATTAQFIYGTDSTLTTGTTTIPIPALTIGTGTADVPVIEPLTGLKPSTTYYYEVQATNSVDTTTGSIMNFTTTAQTVTTPTITVGQATNVTANGATANATVNPNGVATTVHFVYGTQPTLTSGTSTTAEQSIGSGTAAVPVTASLTGLQPGTTYYYQAVATSNGVATPGPIASFTTTAAAAGPMVTNLQRFGYHGQPTKFVLTFDQPLNPTSAQDVHNYQIVPMTGAGSGSPIPLSSAVYNSSNHTVTLLTVNPVYLYGSYQLTVIGTSPSGLSSTTGQFLQGQGTGKPGTNYVTTFGESILAGPDVTASMSRVTRARIMRTWKHDLAMGARIAARLARTRAEHRTQAVKTVHHVTTATAAGAGEHAAAVDVVLGSITVSPTSHHSRR